jgi:hypothetical protein
VKRADLWLVLGVLFVNPKPREGAASPSLLSIGQGIKIFNFGEGRILAVVAGSFGNGHGRISRRNVFYLTETEVETKIAIDRDSNNEVGLSGSSQPYHVMLLL